MSLKISVVTTVFNAKDTIEQTIKSILQQNYSNIEYIIIDGGSKDGTLEIIEKYKNSIDYFVSEGDKGIYDGMNKGISIANGEVIYFLNADDELYDKEVISNIVKEFEQEKDLAMIFGNVLIQDKKSQLNYLTNIKYYEKDVVRKVESMNHQGVFIKTSVIKKLGMFDLSFKLAADTDLLYKVFIGKYPSKYTKKIVAKFTTGGFGANKKLAYDEEKRIIKKQLGKIRLFKFIIKRKIINILSYIFLKLGIMKKYKLLKAKKRNRKLDYKY
ncbi:MAG: glycosyltransferase family 2 protein [bacterium]